MASHTTTPGLPLHARRYSSTTSLEWATRRMYSVSTGPTPTFGPRYNLSYSGKGTRGHSSPRTRRMREGTPVRVPLRWPSHHAHRGERRSGTSAALTRCPPGIAAGSPIMHMGQDPHRRLHTNRGSNHNRYPNWVAEQTLVETTVPARS